MYKKHIFICVNQKTNGKKCCNDIDAKPYVDYFKQSLVGKDCHGAGKYRVSSSGCLGRCRKGPCLVIYPEGVWYSYHSRDDLDKIIDSHLLAGEIVSELEIKSE